MVGSSSGLGVYFGRGCVLSHARPAAFIVVGALAGWLAVLLYFIPLLSGLSVVLIGFLWSGLGLREGLGCGNGKAGGTPKWPLEVRFISSCMVCTLSSLAFRKGRGFEDEGRSE